MNPLYYFGERFVMELLSNQQRLHTTRGGGFIDIDQLYPLPMSVFRQHVGFTCIRNDVYFGYEDSNELIDGIQNAEFDEYCKDITPHVMQEALNQFQMTHVRSRQLVNPSVIRVW